LSAAPSPTIAHSLPPTLKVAQNRFVRGQFLIPEVLAFIAFGAGTVMAIPIFEWLGARDVTPKDLYATVLNWAAIQTGFLFSVDASVRSAQGRFAQQLERNGFRAQFSSRLFQLLMAALILCGLSAMLLIVNMKADGPATHMIFGVWVGLSVYMLAHFIEAILIYRILTKDDIAPK
jgi:hypothetical protein